MAIRKAGFNPGMLRLVGAQEVQLLDREPDATTFRDDHYYNTLLNALFVKVQTGYALGWKRISQ